MADAAERARKFKAAKMAAGLVQCNVWVPRGCEAEIKRAAEMMGANPSLRVGRLVDQNTGRMKGLK
jgi:hypothetical protein